MKRIVYNKNHTRISSPDWPVTFKIWNKVLPTMTKRKTPRRMGPILFSYCFFWVKNELLVFWGICQCWSCNAFRSSISFIDRWAFSYKNYFYIIVRRIRVFYIGLILLRDNWSKYFDFIVFFIYFSQITFLQLLYAKKLFIQFWFLVLIFLLLKVSTFDKDSLIKRLN